MRIYFNNRFFLTLAIYLTMCLCSCSEPVNEGFEKEFTEAGCLVDATKDEVLSNYSVNVYLETSGSMFGFMPSNNKTSFQTTVWDIVSQINTSQRGQLKMYQLKSKNESPVPVELSTFRDDLNSGLFRSSSSTDIPEMLDTVLAKTRKNLVSILISDLIFSPTGKSPALMDQITTDIRNRFAGKSWSSDIIQVNSEFYFKGGKKYEPKSPYYIWIIGDRTQVGDVSKKIKSRLAQFNEIKHGLSNSKMPYTILPFAIPSPSATPLPCIGTNRYYIYGNWDGSSAVIKVPIALNLAEFPPDRQLSQYWKKNIQMESTSAKVTMENFMPQTDAPNNTDNKLTTEIGATHVLQLGVSGLKNESNLIRINVKGQAPGWVGQINQEANDGLRQRTNGFKRMITGLDQAFPNERRLFNKDLLILITKRTY